MEFPEADTTAVLASKEEIALPIRGKKSRLNVTDFVDYFGKERLALSDTVIQKELLQFKDVQSKWEELIHASFLTKKLQERYQKLIHNRWQRIAFSE